jgi:hypothetical protein
VTPLVYRFFNPGFWIYQAGTTRFGHLGWRGGENGLSLPLENVRDRRLKLVSMSLQSKFFFNSSMRNTPGPMEKTPNTTITKKTKVICLYVCLVASVTRNVTQRPLRHWHWHWPPHIRVRA